MVGRAAALVVRAYQLTLGRLLPARCRFYPSCSEYAIQALRTNGLVRGLGQTCWRLARCGPWTAGGVDHVKPTGKRARAAADGSPPSRHNHPQPIRSPISG